MTFERSNGPAPDSAPRLRKRASRGLGAGFIVSLAAAIVAVASLLLLIFCAPRTGAWLIWVLGALSVLLSGVAIWLAFAMDRAALNQALAVGGAVVSVIAIVVGCICLPRDGGESSSATTAPAEVRDGGESSSATTAPAEVRDGGESSSATTAPAEVEASVEGLQSITTGMENDMESSLKAVTDKLTETEGKLGDTYESYVNNMSAMDDWYDFLQAESHRLYAKLGSGSVQYWQTLSKIAQNDKYLDADALSEDYYDSIYDGVLDDWYDAVYDGLFDDLYGKYYDGVLNEAPESVPYAQVSDVRSTTYKALSDARSDWYSDLSDMRRDVYGLYTQIRSSIYNKDYDFTKDIERYQKKFAQFNDDQSAQ